MARKVGVSKQYVYLVQQGKSPPSKRFKKLCALVLHQSEEELFPPNADPPQRSGNGAESW